MSFTAKGVTVDEIVGQNIKTRTFPPATGIAVTDAGHLLVKVGTATLAAFPPGKWQNAEVKVS